jgi:diguanylate cyclase (GGDEF)-like protein
VRLIFKNLNILRSALNAISTASDPKGIIESTGTYLPGLFSFASFGIFWKAGLLIHLYQDESCLPSFTKGVVENMIKVFHIFGEKSIDVDRLTFTVDKKGARPDQKMGAKTALKSHLTLPLAVEGEVLGCISLDSEQPNAFDVQDLQFISVIGYQIAATLKQFQKISTIKDQAIYDKLTTLHNRRYFDEKIKAETQKAFSSRTPLSLVMVDIDFFKKVNDTYGHHAGDSVLSKIASLLKNSVRKDDTVARYGGEEFILVLPGAKLEVTAIIAERIRRLIETTPFEIEGGQIHITISMGISNLPTHQAKSGEDLVKMADQALYKAKNEGRNRVCIFMG